jgi:transposase InsO family protein
MQTELLDRRRIWGSRIQLANAMFEWIEVFYSRQRRHSTLDDKTPVDDGRTRPIAPAVTAWQPNPRSLLNGGTPGA